MDFLFPLNIESIIFDPSVDPPVPTIIISLQSQKMDNLLSIALIFDLFFTIEIQSNSPL